MATEVRASRPCTEQSKKNSPSFRSCCCPIPDCHHGVVRPQRRRVQGVVPLCLLCSGKYQRTSACDFTECYGIRPPSTMGL